MSTRRSPLSYVALGVLWLYRNAISPWFAPRCRYYPSCSTYAVEAVKEWGGLRGSWLAIKRVFRCNPWSLGGIDDVPRRSTESAPAVPVKEIDGLSRVS